MIQPCTFCWKVFDDVSDFCRVFFRTDASQKSSKQASITQAAKHKDNIQKKRQEMAETQVKDSTVFKPAQELLQKSRLSILKGKQSSTLIWYDVVRRRVFLTLFLLSTGGWSSSPSEDSANASKFQLLRRAYSAFACLIIDHIDPYCLVECRRTCLA